ncbi:tripartite tricarboxylate transporter TctB family protein [Bifidobacterium indicum]|uniref:tripartite tricarboxylate transporter TctB family protein n=1 Tax=Bifidobacterium indicum TaxID=1691 RepID=UPI002636E8AE|nr:tripartite tricarboxylate transporter TctB family protein [uncultured Bifidobacterium sp.]
MTNRAERRAQAKRSRRGERDQYQGVDRGRAGLVDERTLQERSRRLAAGQSGEWKPTGHSDLPDEGQVSNPNYRNPKLVRSPHSFRQWMRILAWFLIIGSGIAFLVCMWFPKIPLWATITMAAVFCLGIVLLFFVGGSYKDNPNLDSYGTAV